jgi:hypothetical protein
MEFELPLNRVTAPECTNHVEAVGHRLRDVRRICSCGDRKPSLQWLLGARADVAAVAKIMAWETEKSIILPSTSRATPNNPAALASD